MVGEDELIRGCNHLATVRAVSQDVKMYQIDKEELLKIKTYSEEAWHSIIVTSKEVSIKTQNEYLECIKKTN